MRSRLFLVGGVRPRVPFYRPPPAPEKWLRARPTYATESFRAVPFAACLAATRGAHAFGTVPVSARSVARGSVGAGLSSVAVKQALQARGVAGRAPPLMARSRPVSTATTLGSTLLHNTDDAASSDKSAPRWRKNTKQIATVGPASNTIEMLEKLFCAGVDIFRLNFSHGAHAEKEALVEKIRQLEKKYHHPIGILADLQGPKLRVGVFANGPVTLERGQSFSFDLDTEKAGDATRVSLPHPEIINTLKVGDTLLVDDGKVRMTVVAAAESAVTCRVDVAGTISDRKGVNTPSIVLPISPLTPKDREDLEAALSMSVDWVALSFVQRPEDMEELRALVGNRALLMAKIEKPSAVDALQGIVAASDGCMVARGDLGVELLPEEVPLIQREIIDECRRQGRPVVVATQMLESMIESPVATRAEASDVAAAVLDGADAVMLSAESAAGKYPEESVRMQQRIITRCEASPSYISMVHSRVAPSVDRAAINYDAIAVAASSLVRDLEAQGVMTFTTTGCTAARFSRMRLQEPLVALTPSLTVARRLSMYWGVYPALLRMRLTDTLDDVLLLACHMARRKGFVEHDDDRFVVTAGLPFGSPGAANVIRVLPASGPQGFLGEYSSSEWSEEVG